MSVEVPGLATCRIQWGKLQDQPRPTSQYKREDKHEPDNNKCFSFRKCESWSLHPPQTIALPSPHPPAQSRHCSAACSPGELLTVAGDCSTAAGQGCRHCRHRPCSSSAVCGVTWLWCRDAATADTADTAAPGKLAGLRYYSPGLNYLSSPENLKTNSLLPPGSVITSGLLDAALISSHSVPSTVNCCRRWNNKSRSHYFPYLFSFLSQSFVVSSTAPRHNTANHRRTKTCLETRG